MDSDSVGVRYALLAGVKLFACAQKERLSEQRELIWVSLGAGASRTGNFDRSLLRVIEIHILGAQHASDPANPKSMGLYL